MDNKANESSPSHYSQQQRERSNSSRRRIEFDGFDRFTAPEEEEHSSRMFNDLLLGSDLEIDNEDPLTIFRPRPKVIDDREISQGNNFIYTPPRLNAPSRSAVSTSRPESVSIHRNTPFDRSTGTTQTNVNNNNFLPKWAHLNGEGLTDEEQDDLTTYAFYSDLDETPNETSIQPNTFSYNDNNSRPMSASVRFSPDLNNRLPQDLMRKSYPFPASVAETRRSSRKVTPLLSTSALVPLNLPAKTSTTSTHENPQEHSEYITALRASINSISDQVHRLNERAEQALTRNAEDSSDPQSEPTTEYPVDSLNSTAIQGKPFGSVNMFQFAENESAYSPQKSGSNNNDTSYRATSMNMFASKDSISQRPVSARVSEDSQILQRLEMVESSLKLEREARLKTEQELSELKAKLSRFQLSLINLANSLN